MNVVLSALSKFTLCIAVVLLSISPAALAALNPQIAIVIDDIGYRQTDFSALELNGQFTYAVVPFAPLTQIMAEKIFASRREIIAHIPMEATSNNHLLGKGALKSSMNEQSTRAQIRLALDNVPYASGINNHMGSKFTTKPKQLTWLMDELAKRQLYFLDSKTTPYSIAERIATERGLQTGHRHVFLDNKLDYDSLDKQFKQLIRIAKRHQLAIAIAHPHPQTVAFLAKIAPRLKALNIDLVPLSTLLPSTTRLAKNKHFPSPRSTAMLRHAVSAK